MKKSLIAGLLALACLLTAAGCQQTMEPEPGGPAYETDPVPVGSLTSDDSAAPQTDAAQKPAPVTDFYLEVGEPRVVYRHEAAADPIGRVISFPQLSRTVDGRIAATWDFGTDCIRYDGIPGWRYSSTEGKTWRIDSDAVNAPATNRMPNGKYFAGFTMDGARPAYYTDAIEPAKTWGEFRLYFREDFPYNADSLVTAREYDPETGEYTSFVCEINWPYAPMVEFPGRQIYPLTQIFAHNSRTIITVDGVMYLAMYYWGFDSFADSREEAVMEYSNKYHCYVFTSADSGRTWNLLSQVYTDAEITNSAEGLCEPEMSVMPDGSVIMLMRTGSNNPSWIVRSTDMCKTWSEPVQFDAIGVLPQLCTLDCGVTIATYGRPEMRVRATSDPTGLTWKEPSVFPLYGGSCYYTDLIPLDAYTALWVYMDTGYPNAQGQGVRTILTRTLTVVPTDAKTATEFTILPGSVQNPKPVQPSTPVTPAPSVSRQTVRPTSVPPTLDGVLTDEEWGDTPDFRLNKEITGGRRTYCEDKYGGDGLNIPAIDYFWRYDAENVYIALRITEPEEFYTPADVTYKGADRSLSVQLGGSSVSFARKGNMTVQPTDGTVIRSSEKDGVRFYEIAVPRKNIAADGDTFPGYVEYCITVYYERHDGIAGTSQTILTRTTPAYQGGGVTLDTFVLAEGTPVAAPDLTVTAGKTGDVDPDGTFTLSLGDPVVVGRGKTGVTHWGYMQFPRLHRTVNGDVLAIWDEGTDSYYYEGDKPHRISADGGKTWTEADAETAPRMDVPMPNGKYFADFLSVGAHTETYLQKHTPAADYGNLKLYYLDDIQNDPAAAADVSLTAQEYDPKTGKVTTFDVTVNWPYAPLAKIGNLVYPFQQMFGLHTRAVIAVGDDLYMPMYFYGFDSFADSREASVMELSHKYSVYVFRSSDSGRTWELLSQVYTDERTPGYAEGVCEPEMTVMPDGSFLMLMRTGGSNPCYMVRSTDGGVTWSDPVKFDDFGVLPQLCTLDCGVTLSTYGRPRMRLRATADPAGETWEEAFEVPVTVTGQSCHYTDLIALDANTALFIYSDFQYPDENGEPVKTVLVRTVTVIPD